MAQLLSVQNLSKSYGGRTLFSDVSFGIEEGDRIGLVGPNGAGKSTLMKILSREISSDFGEVVCRRGLRIGYLSQNPVFNDQDTILSRLLRGVKEDETELGKAYEWMAKLDLNQFGENFLVSKLSGGWQKRVALAEALIQNPELLLLDEPTNHLDVHQILWLETFLQRAPFAVLTITHDRLFLQRVVNRVLDLDPKNPKYLLSMKGDYLKYIENKESLLRDQQEREKVLKNIYLRELEWLRRGAQARQTKQKARIERAYELKDDLGEVRERNRARTAGITFDNMERSPQKLIEIQNLKIQFGDRVLFENFSYLVTPKTRLALLGDNGVGKTSLIRALMGELQPTSGLIKIGDGVRVAYFEQTRQTLDLQKSLLRNIVAEGDFVDCRGEYIYAKSYLERFLFKSHQMDLPVAQLSGGEQSRLRLAQLMLQKVQVLILDEPTNDLDVETLDVLQKALEDFNGAVLLVTHDRYFMDQVAHEILSFTPMDETGTSQLDLFVGYMQWESWDEEYRKTSPKNSLKDRSHSSKDFSDSPQKSSKPQRLSYKEKQDLENMEKNILNLESKYETLKLRMEDPSCATNGVELMEISHQMAQLKEDLNQLYERWAYLEKRSQGEI